MSFQNQGFWAGKGAECLNDGKGGYDSSSKVELKRPQQWLMDGPETDLFPNKKLAVGVPTTNLFTGMLSSNATQWSNSSSFQSISGVFTERLFDTDASRTLNFDDQNISTVNSGKLSLERKVDEGSFENDSPFGLSMSYQADNSRSSLSFGGIKKVKVSQVKESENVIPVYDGVDSTISMAHTYGKTDENSMSMGLPFDKGGNNAISIGETYDRENNMFISMGQPYNKEDGSTAMSQPPKETDGNLVMGHAFSKADDHCISMGQIYNRAVDNSISVGNIYNKEHDGAVSLGQTYYRIDNNNNLSISQSYNKAESTIISFGGCDNDDTNPSGRLISGYDLLISQPSSHTNEVSEKQLARANSEGAVSTSHIAVSGDEDISKNRDDSKATKKVPPNSFPSNVRSLLSTGMFDGVPVKYTAWSQEKELRGFIRGTGYLCGCPTCNFSKVINAYEFERHANCKTKHPNNHIYFENGKTIYGVVQELRSTPQNMLFDVIQTVTGSSINQKSFRLWKESFVAATRELQRIYGKDEGMPP